MIGTITVTSLSLNTCINLDDIMHSSINYNNNDNKKNNNACNDIEDSDRLRSTCSCCRERAMIVLVLIKMAQESSGH